MKLRQRKWIIWIRPRYSTKDDGVTTYSGVPYAPSLSGGSYTSLSGMGAGMEENSSVEYKKGCYVQWYATTSFVKLKQKYKELLDIQPNSTIIITEEIPMDTIIYPQA